MPRKIVKMDEIFLKAAFCKRPLMTFTVFHLHILTQH